MSRFSRKAAAPTLEPVAPTALKFVPPSSAESHYLMSNIGKLLAAGITQVLASRCDDPVDALGRFLLKHDENRVAFENEERERLEAKGRLNNTILPHVGVDSFTSSSISWRSIDKDKLFRPPTPRLTPVAATKQQAPAPPSQQPSFIELQAVDPSLVPPPIGSGIAAVDNAIMGSQELRIQQEAVVEDDTEVSIKDLEQDAILPGGNNVPITADLPAEEMTDQGSTSGQDDDGDVDDEE